MRSLLRVAVLLALVSGLYLGSAEALPPQQCIGSCTVHCGSGGTQFYSTTKWQCCAKVANCPTETGYAEWSPGYGIACQGQYGEICV
jgi:hypothetical protein